MAKLEVRHVSLRASDSGQPMRLIGRAVTYDSLSKVMASQSGGFAFRERVLPGAFTRSLADPKSDVIATFNHNEQAIPLGRQKSGTLKLSDGPQGLDFALLLDSNNSEHRNLYSAVRRGDIGECSFGFHADDDDWDDDQDCKDDDGNRCARRTIRAATLFSTDVVVHPAYNETTVAARGLGRKILNTLFPKKSLEQTFVDANGFDPWLAQARLIRQDMEIRVGAARLERARRNVAVDGPGYGPTRDSSGGGQVADPTTSLRCPAGSCTSTKEEHEQAVSFHRNLAARGNFAEFCSQTTMGDNHQAVLDALADYDDDDDYSDCVNRCVASCSREAWVSKHGSYVANMHGKVS